MFECINTHFSWSTLLGFEGRRPNTNDNILILPRPSSSIQSLYPSASISICTSTSTTPHKYNYTKVAASSNSNHGDGGDDDDDNLIQQDISAASPSRPNFFQFDDYGSNETISPDTNGLNFNKTGSSNSKSLHLDVDDDDNASLPIPRITRKKQTINRSSILAKQVITIHSAITLGFVSQLWLDTSSWLVLVVELRPNLLSAQAERFVLHDIHQVGDVVLVQDESVTDNEIKMVGLETLVGYNVVTPGRRNIGKVRGYNFNVNTGAVVSLELDSFGISIIPSSLVSTYALFVEDVLEVVSDTVVVHEAAAAHIQRLTKGFWESQKAIKFMDEFGGFSDLENPVQPEYSWGRRQSSISGNLQAEVGEMDVDWELPMDYL